MFEGEEWLARLDLLGETNEQILESFDRHKRLLDMFKAVSFVVFLLISLKGVLRLFVTDLEGMVEFFIVCEV